MSESYEILDIGYVASTDYFDSAIKYRGSSGSSSITNITNNEISVYTTCYNSQDFIPINILTGKYPIKIVGETYSNTNALTPGFGIMFGSNQNVVDATYFTVYGEVYNHITKNGALIRDSRDLYLGSFNGSWLKWEITIESNQWNIKWFNSNGTLVGEQTESLSDFTMDENVKYGLITGWNTSGTIKWRNITIHSV